MLFETVWSGKAFSEMTSKDLSVVRKRSVQIFKDEHSGQRDQQMQMTRVKGVPNLYKGELGGPYGMREK